MSHCKVGAVTLLLLSVFWEEQKQKSYEILFKLHLWQLMRQWWNMLVEDLEAVDGVLLKNTPFLGQIAKLP